MIIQIAELYRHGWDKFDLSGLVGTNLLHVYEGAEMVSREIRASGATPIFNIYDKRPDLPAKLKGEL